MAVNEEDGVGSGDVVTETLCKAAKVVVIGASPKKIIRSLDEVAVLEAHVNDGIFTVAVWMAVFPRNNVGSFL